VGSEMLATGQTATLTVTLKAHGKYEFLCTVPGHAGAGMKGLLGVGVKVTAPASANASATGPSSSTSGSSSSSSSSSTGPPCTSPKSTTVSVNEFDFGITLSPASPWPCGSITFNITNTGNVNHDFTIQGLPGGAGHGSLIDPGQRTTMTVTIGPGSYYYQCDFDEHAEQGMEGYLTVSG
jgi:uncharacterized cupredoxin-like copper-binding protein